MKVRKEEDTGSQPSLLLTYTHALACIFTHKWVYTQPYTQVCTQIGTCTYHMCAHVRTHMNTCVCMNRPLLLIHLN